MSAHKHGISPHGHDGRSLQFKASILEGAEGDAGGWSDELLAEVEDRGRPASPARLLHQQATQSALPAVRRTEHEGAGRGLQNLADRRCPIGRKVELHWCSGLVAVLRL